MSKKSLIVTVNSISEAYKVLSSQEKSKECASKAITKIIEKAQTNIASFNIEQLCLLIKAEANIIGINASSSFKNASIENISKR